ncbi:hypothetical protein KC660_01940 [Candidatus Dojkabacteria bacterium]|uniref:Uncharacterized protein n=1 Tax=Candidatus Dojkabacteria bacterium TaxID=2099670 RepID=A0A955L3A3_9BACT|nr:hypothetical protein [Candidatus Dojkabacteria bacterium]
MDLDQIIRNQQKQTRNQIEVYKGIEGYTLPLIKRIIVGKSPIRQIINGQLVADYHKNTDPLINEFISKRVENGISMKNLIRQEDKDLSIEISNPETLKQTRLLPKGFLVNGIIATFGDYTAITSLDKKKTVGIIVNDSTITEMFNSIFESLWENGERV